MAILAALARRWIVFSARCWYNGGGGITFTITDFTTETMKHMKDSKMRALAALMDEHATFTSAAAAAGISRRTLYNYLNGDLDFARAYKQQCEMQIIEKADDLAQARQAALDVLLDLMKDDQQPGVIRLRAAAAVVNAANDAAAAAKSLAVKNVSELTPDPFGISF